MHYLTVSAWVFALLLLMIALLFLYPAIYIIGFSVMFLPLVIVIQAFVILRAKGGTPKNEHNRWYEHHN